MERIFKFIKKFIPSRLFWALAPAYHFTLAFLAALIYRFPSLQVAVIGVTGTKGKTTVVHLLHEILNSSGPKTASVSSLRFKIGEAEEPNMLKMTMPGRFFIQRFLRRAYRTGCKFAVIEVTSQGIAQFRHRGIRFASAVMTNIAPEHIEAHGGFERYLRAKLDLFWRLSKDAAAVINCDDPHWRRFAASTAAHRACYTKESIAANGKDWKIGGTRIDERGILFEIEGRRVESPLCGEFNFYNILAAIAVALSEGMPLEKIIAAVGRFSGVPGRMEFIKQEPFAVVVDYAHTPDSLRSVYQTLRSENQEPKTKSQKLICVLGAAGGGRDRWKRPEMGRVAAEFCSEIILTDEDPYDENPAAILDEIAAGFSKTQNLHPPPKFLAGGKKPKTQNHQKILDRRKAIRAAVKLAQSGDTVIITGKGAEPWIMGPAGSKIPWDDRAVAREELLRML